MFRFKNLVAAVFCRNCYRGCPGKRLVGPYAGFKIRQNWSDASGEITKSSHTPTFPGEMAGYNFDVGNFIVGPEVFADMHHGSTTYKDAGDGIKFGMPS